MIPRERTSTAAYAATTSTTASAIRYLVALEPAEWLAVLFLISAGPFLAQVRWLEGPYALLTGLALVGLPCLGLSLLALHVRLSTGPAISPVVSRRPRLDRVVVVARWVLATLFCLAAYSSMTWVIPIVNPVAAVSGGGYDAIFASIELSVFSQAHPTLLAQTIASPLATSWFSLMYAVHALWFFLTPFVLSRQRRDLEQSNVTLALLLSMYAGYVGYVAVPILGPLWGMIDQYSAPLDDTLVTTVVRDLGVAYGTFPSLHAGVSFVVVVFAWRYNRRLFWPLLFFALNVWLSTIYLRYHYVLDLIAGWLLAAAAIWLSPRVNAWMWRRRSGGGSEEAFR